MIFYSNEVIPVTTALATRLRQARERLLLTQDQVEESTGIGVSSLSEFENDHRQPNLDQLDRLARLYRRSGSWFLEDAPEPESVVLWRERPEPTLAADIGATFLRLCEQFRNLEIWCGEPVDADLPRMALPPRDRFRSSDAARLAKRVRDDLQLGDRPGEGLMRTLEEACGLKVFHLAFEPTGTAACTRSEAFGVGILLNSASVPWRRAFDLAHELFHLLTWEVFRPGWTGEPATAEDREEKFANVFAANLLMPEEPFRLAVGRRMAEPDPDQLGQVYAIAREFDVSVPAVLKRMAFLFRLQDESTAALQVWKRTSRLFEDRGGEPLQDRPDRFRALALSALRAGELSIGRFAEYMGISRYRAMSIARRLEEDGEEVDPPAPA